MIDDTEEQSVFLVYETIGDEYEHTTEDIVRGVYSRLQSAQNEIGLQIDPSLWWIEEWVVDE